MTITINEFVSREIIYCVSSLVSTLVSAASETGSVGDVSQEELFDLCQRDDWDSAAQDYIRNMSTDDIEAALEGFGDVVEAGSLSDNDAQQRLIDYLQESSGFREFCDDFRIDPQMSEVYEHWIVSNWLADKLEAKGEIIARDIAGLTIWGRCTTGQAISMDYVIGEIYKEMIAA